VSYLFILCAKLWRVEYRPSWSVNVFNATTAEDSHVLSVAGHSRDSGSQNDEHFDHNALLEAKRAGEAF
jgi:hypothetical protein